jgi:hypothetical protein
MSEPLDLATLERLAARGCQAPGCTHSKHGPLMLASRCHTGAPVRASYTAGDGYVELACTRCGKLVARITVAGEAPSEALRVQVQDPPTLQRIDALWAYLANDVENGGEGLIAGQMDGMWMPLIAADYPRLDALRPYVLATARHAPKGTVVKLVKFRQREELETIEP